MKYVTVKVTTKHIQKGRRTNISQCPVALAARDGGFPNARVAGNYWRPNGPATTTAPVSLRAQAFITRFDLGKPVQPATFRLPLPETSA